MDYSGSGPFDLSTEFPRQEHWSRLPFSSPRGFSWPRDLTRISCIVRQILYHWATREVPLQLELYANIEIKHLFSYLFGPFPGGANGKEPTCQYRDVRDSFDPCVGKIPWSRKWQPTPIFLPRESHGQRSLVGYNSLWGRKEPDTTEAT